MKYVNSFLQRNSSLDILNIVKPVKDLPKEISEAMGVYNEVKSCIHSDDKIGLIDLCAGNGLAGLTCLFNLKEIKHLVAVDKASRQRDWTKIRNFNYLQEDISDSLCTEYVRVHFTLGMNIEKYIVLACHCCKRLPEQIIDFCNHFIRKIQNVILVPCCQGPLDPKYIPSSFEQDKLGNYGTWAVYIKNMVMGKTGLSQDRIKIKQDKNILSPKNIVINVKWS